MTVDQVEVVIRYSERNESFFGDQLLSEYFIESFDIPSGHLADIFNDILNSGYFLLSAQKA